MPTETRCTLSLIVFNQQSTFCHSYIYLRSPQKSLQIFHTQKIHHLLKPSLFAITSSIGRGTRSLLCLLLSIVLVVVLLLLVVLGPLVLCTGSWLVGWCCSWLGPGLGLGSCLTGGWCSWLVVVGLLGRLVACGQYRLELVFLLGKIQLYGLTFKWTKLLL